MRNVLYAINLTLDGCCDHTKGFADEEIHDFYTNLLRDVDLLVFGRKTYELMVPFWPEVAKNQSMDRSGNEFALAFDSKQKVVFSRTLDKADDKNTRVVRTDLYEEIRRLKQERGKTILLGGVDVPTQLMQRGLIDEYLFMVSPTFAGEGRRLFDNVPLRENVKLNFVGSTLLRSGCIALRYSAAR